MENKNDAVFTDDVVFLEEMDYIEIDEDQKELDDLVKVVVCHNLEQNFNKPEMLENEALINKIEKEVKRKLNINRNNLSLSKNRDQIIETLNEIAFNLLKNVYKLKPDETRMKSKLSKVKGGIFNVDDLRTAALPSLSGVKSVSLPSSYNGLIK